MSRLDSFIRRLSAQRACLDAAIVAIGSREGCVLEIGLGNGRTFDHLREAMPGREIFVFDRQINAHPDCVPDEGHLFLGDFRETLPAATRRLGRRAILVHADIGSGDVAASRSLGAAIAPLIAAMAAPGARILSDQPLPSDTWQAEALPHGVEAGRYHLYWVDGA
ncbi:MAG: hypothetical protein HOH66_07800 [Rhodospirillaceae bacterium]|nr:hypothetical protein [Rhodospirillaceae bacterium]MBT6117756.1 hypothetical protein [Rhodospirillaceae bacterium]